MRFLLDTNVLVSAALFPHGTPGQAYNVALSTPLNVIVCDYTITEFRKVFRVKFPKQVEAAEHFIAGMVPGIIIVPTPDSVEGVDVKAIRDAKDWPILRAAVAARADAIVSGDKDLLECGLTHPTMLTPAQFLAAAQQIDGAFTDAHVAHSNSE